MAFKHFSFDDESVIADWAERNGHRMLKTWESELVEAPYIRKAEEILSETRRCADSAALLRGLLDRVAAAPAKASGKEPQPAGL